MPNDYKKKQQELTELNSDGNETRGRNGEDYDTSKPWIDEDKFLSKREKLRKSQAQDPANDQL